MLINGVITLIIILYIFLAYKVLFWSDKGIRLSRSNEKYHVIYKLIDEYCLEIGIKQTVHLHVWPREKDIWQAAAKRRFIILSKKLVEIYLTDWEKYDLTFRFLLLHELMHIKNKDVAFELKGLLKGIDYLRAIRCLKEVRADIQAVNIVRLNDQEINVIFNHIITDQEEGYCNSYRHGYPSKANRKKYVQKYQSFTEEAAIEVWEDFLRGIALNNQKVSFKEVAERLFRQVNYY